MEYFIALIYIYIPFTVDSSQQQFPAIITCHQKLHLRWYIGLELNFVKWSTKILKGFGGHPPSWSSAVLKKYEKRTLLDALKIHFQRFFTLNYGYDVFSKATKPFDFIKPNVIQKFDNKLKYISEINEGLIMFFFPGNSRIRLF